MPRYRTATLLEDLSLFESVRWRVHISCQCGLRMCWKTALCRIRRTHKVHIRARFSSLNFPRKSGQGTYSVPFEPSNKRWEEVRR